MCSADPKRDRKAWWFRAGWKLKMRPDLSGWRPGKSAGIAPAKIDARKTSCKLVSAWDMIPSLSRPARGAWIETHMV